MGIAMGCMGMGLDDFCRCTPLEFAAIFKAWQRRDERMGRTAWEQTRFLACCTLQPYSKKRLVPTDICRFLWEKSSTEEPEAEASTREQFERITTLWSGS